MMIAKDHPYWHIRTVVERNEDISALVFSYYEYVPQSLTDIREKIVINRNDFLEEKNILTLINSTPSDRELALHSTIFLFCGECKHLPMIDMSTGSAAQLTKVKPLLGRELFLGFKWYKSGRSYHGYGSELIDRGEWMAQMGKLLLVNQIGMPTTVDPRWVGHRLIAGYSALRWTKNTAHYLDFPRKLID